MSLILGINHSLHESSVALIDEKGHIVFAQAEERISRIKFDSEFPAKILRAGLDYVGASIEDVQHVGLSFPRAETLLLWQFEALVRRRLLFSRHNALAPVGGYLETRRRDRSARALGSVLSVTSFGHHLSHGLAAAMTCGFDEAAIVVIDGKGARSATSVWHFYNGKIERIMRIDFPNSLGVFYASITGFLGFEPFADEWKVMGLASYGEPGIDLSQVIKPGGGSYRVNGKALLGRRAGDYSALASLAGPVREANGQLTQHHRNVAFAAQQACEEAMLEVARTAHRLTGSSRLCLVGGVAMNCKANGRVLADGPFEDVFVPPAASDEGASLGAAYAAGAQYGAMSHPLRDARLGVSWSDEEVERVLVTCGLRYVSLKDSESAIASALANNQVVARFAGRGEFGARALGARSILGNPAKLETRNRVNEAVKYREAWRPFAPIVMEERAHEYFINFRPSPFMALTFQATDRARELAPAIVHEDGTARVQSVNVRDDPDLYRLVLEFSQRTGLPILLNTSFNLKGEPIVYSPTDAIRTFFASGLEVLFINSFMVTK